MENQYPNLNPGGQNPTGGDPVTPPTNPITDFLLSHSDPEPVKVDPTPAPAAPAATPAADPANPVVPVQVPVVDNSWKQDMEAFKRDQGVRDFFADPNNSDYKTYEKQIRELAARPETKNLTVSAIANMVVPPSYWLKRGADEAAKANSEAQSAYNGGSSARPVGGGEGGTSLPDPNTLDSKAFMETAWKIARGN